MDIQYNDRAVGSTEMNDRSSRMHNVLTGVDASTNRLTGLKLTGAFTWQSWLVANASQKSSDSLDSCDCLKEANHINKSLSALAALASKSNHVPFENSNSIAPRQSFRQVEVMFMHVDPGMSSRGGTLRTAMFGVRVSQISLGQAQENAKSGKIYEAISNLS
ncbi:hypothetical protein BSKO_09084 [Bryopsis sp. KO-2023]|nr:hypothetical protein BSKO_09084 [Bryopsis sp. KO-2023]